MVHRADVRARRSSAPHPAPADPSDGVDDQDPGTTTTLVPAPIIEQPTDASEVEPEGPGAPTGRRAARAARGTARRGRSGPPIALVSVVASLASGLVILGAVPGQLAISVRSGLVLALAGLAQLVGPGLALWRRRRLTLGIAAVAAAGVPLLWLLTRPLGVIHAPGMWISINAVVGAADVVVAVLGATAAVGFTLAATYGRLRGSTLGQRIGLAMLRGLGVAAVALLVVVATVASWGSLGRAFASPTTSLYGLPSGQTSTVRYCAPDGVPLLMDVHMPPSDTGAGLHPAVLYLHGGAFMVGDRSGVGLTGRLAELNDPTFAPTLSSLTSRGVIVATIDYRLIPSATWPAPVDDAECAVRFLREHAADLGVDGRRIGVWGSGAGATVASLVGLAAPKATVPAAHGSDKAYPSGVQAVVDVSGVSDFTHMSGTSPLLRTGSWLTAGADPAAASPADHVQKGSGPPFLVVHAAQNGPVPASQASRFADRLDAAGMPCTMVTVGGAAGPVGTQGQRPSAAQVSAKIVDFLTTSLGSAGS